MAEIHNDIKKFSDKYFAWMQENITNILGIKIFLEEQKTSSKYNEMLDKSYKLQMRSFLLDAKIEILRGSVNIFLETLILFIAALYILDWKWTLGGLVAFNTYLVKLLNAISKILEINMNKQVVNISYERILSLLEGKEFSDRKRLIGLISKIKFESVFLVRMKRLFCVE